MRSQTFVPPGIFEERPLNKSQYYRTYFLIAFASMLVMGGITHPVLTVAVSDKFISVVPVFSQTKQGQGKEAILAHDNKVGEEASKCLGSHIKEEYGLCLIEGPQETPVYLILCMHTSCSPMNIGSSVMNTVEI